MAGNVLRGAKRTFAAVHKAIDAGLVRACHDMSEGGLAVAAAEMAFAGNLGARLFLAQAPHGIEIDEPSAKTLVENRCIAVGEGANMPSTPEAIAVFQDAGVRFGPAKAANAGGVATSALEMCQNSMRLSWTFDEVDNRLKIIMNSIYDQCMEASEAYATKGDLVAGANIGGFLKVAKAMAAQGLV